MRECGVVLDVGAGIRPMNLYKPKQHICVEPFEPYCKILKNEGYSDVWHMTAMQALRYCLDEFVPIEAIFLLDVIEHMEKEHGQHVIELAQAVALEQIVLYTPYGFMVQNEDKWGLGGDEWQIHRSGWVPEEFPGWHIEVRPMYVRPKAQGGVIKGFIALWDRKTP